MEASAPHPRHPSPSSGPSPADRRSCCNGSGLLVRAIVIAAAAVAAGAAHSWVDPFNLRASALVDAPEVGHVNPVDPAPPVEGPLDPATLGPRISLEQARALFEAGEYLFIDTRPKQQFDEGRILGAFHLSTKEFGEPEGTEVLSMLRPEDHFVLYCGGGDCDDSENVAARLESAGVKHFHIMTAGFQDWKDAGYDIEPAEPAEPPEPEDGAP